MNQERRAGAVAAVSRSLGIHVVEIKLDQQQQHIAVLLYIKHHSTSGHIIDGAIVLLHLLLAIRADMSTVINAPCYHKNSRDAACSVVPALI